MKKITNGQGLKKSHVRILGFLLANPGKSFTQLELAKGLGMEKSYKNVREGLQELAEEGIIAKEDVGASVVCSLNFKAQKALDYVSYLENAKRYELFRIAPKIQEISERLVEQVKLHTPFFTLLFFGSYANGTFQEKSDVDLIVIAEKKYQAGIGRELANLQAIYSLKLNFFVMTQNDYENMLKSKEPVNVGKESLKNHVLLYGTELYCQMVRDALW